MRNKYINTNACFYSSENDHNPHQKMTFKDFNRSVRQLLTQYVRLFILLAYISSDSSGVKATYPCGVAMPCSFINSMLMCSWTFRLRTDPIDAAAAGILLDRAAVVRMREVATLLNMMDEW